MADTGYQDNDRDSGRVMAKALMIDARDDVAWVACLAPRVRADGAIIDSTAWSLANITAKGDAASAARRPFAASAPVIPLFASNDKAVDLIGTAARRALTGRWDEFLSIARQ